MKRRTSTRDAAWLEVALSDPIALLQDHAHCEKKAAASAMGLVSRYWDRPRLVTEMIALAQEELAHFARVHAALVARGARLSADDGDPYVQALMKHVGGGTKQTRLVDRLLVSALIEARSCERLRLLGKHHPDPELAALFADFAKAEARHGHLFVTLARELSDDPAAVDRRLAELDAIEQAVVEAAPLRCAIH